MGSRRGQVGLRASLKKGSIIHSVGVSLRERVDGKREGLWKTIHCLSPSCMLVFV